jgi:hypothetical protein
MLRFKGVTPLRGAPRLTAARARLGLAICRPAAPRQALVGKRPALAADGRARLGQARGAAGVHVAAALQNDVRCRAEAVALEEAAVCIGAGPKLPGGSRGKGGGEGKRGGCVGGRWEEGQGLPAHPLWWMQGAPRGPPTRQWRRRCNVGACMKCPLKWRATKLSGLACQGHEAPAGAARGKCPCPCARGRALAGGTVGVEGRGARLADCGRRVEKGLDRAAAQRVQILQVHACCCNGTCRRPASTSATTYFYYIKLNNILMPSHVGDAWSKPCALPANSQPTSPGTQ